VALPDTLTTSDDVETALLRPLTAGEGLYIDDLMVQATELLRLARPSIDARIARYTADPTDPGGVSAKAVAAVLAGVIKKYLINPTGIATTTRSVGPYSQSIAYALRSEKERRGALEITDDDIAVLFPSRKRPRAGTIRTRPALAPRPVGRYGPIPTPGQAVDAEITYSRNPVLDSERVLFLEDTP
jgi:hypothetical protein